MFLFTKNLALVFLILNLSSFDVIFSARASIDEIGTIFKFLANDRPFIVAAPTRSPVKLPGPTHYDSAS